ncbi:MAG: PQQ-dependent sugar dehydrogenase [Bacteroidetes bacterium]|nr:PQQ-dependent sugar dehydrogenase [Bacteroidota bacterium]
MKILSIAVLATAAIAIISCNSNDKKETKAPIIQSPNYPPAFKGQTHIDSVKTTTAYTVDLLDTTLGRPWAIIPMPGNQFLVTERSGYMMILDENGKLLKKIHGLPAVWDRGQGGLLDVALGPQFTKNKMIYWTFSEPQSDSVTNLTAVAKGELSEKDSMVKNPVVIFRATPALKSDFHFGSRLLFDKEGNIFVSAGERSILEGRKQAQDLSSGLGKIFHITKEGKPVAGNPFINTPNARPEIYSYGHRNPQGLDINPATGDLWEAEFGPRGGDEVNLIQPGHNYGWPVITYGIEYDGRKIGDSIQQKEGMEQPVYFWDPVSSPSGITFYNADSIPEWKNNLFLGGLSSMQIIRLVIVNNKVTGEESLLADKKERFRDLTVYKGMLFAVTDYGHLYRIRKK